jgi:sterol desaturase/sphingolipid hydroxylase (fatty acid hydroxylase superfamily)
VATVLLILAAMGVVALVETVLPLHARGRWHRAHVRPNLGLTCIAFATNLLFNSALVVILFALETSHGGLLARLSLPAAVSAVVAVIALDLSFYVAHRVMHWSPICWRFHAIHHSDPALDVTTTIRQHPAESVIRYAFMGAAAIVLGPSPGAFAVYRLWSALNGLLEHANIHAPERLDKLLSLVVVTPNMHKVHHSRTASETNTNYGNIFSLFDRACATFTPSRRGTQVAFGLDGFDEDALSSTSTLLAHPFRRPLPSAPARYEPMAQSSTG